MQSMHAHAYPAEPNQVWELDDEEQANGERELSEYEKLREDNIRRNREKARELGFNI